MFWLNLLVGNILDARESYSNSGGELTPGQSWRKEDHNLFGTETGLGNDRRNPKPVRYGWIDTHQWLYFWENGNLKTRTIQGLLAIQSGTRVQKNGTMQLWFNFILLNRCLRPRLYRLHQLGLCHFRLLPDQWSLRSRRLLPRQHQWVLLPAYCAQWQRWLWWPDG